MTVTKVDKDPAALTLTLHAEFDASVERTWQLFGDPRQLERWWGPPGYPSTFTAHDLSVGGEMAYFMTGPEGEKYAGWWEIREVDAPTRLVFDEGFANDNGERNTDMPTSVMTVELAERSGGGTALSIRTNFASAEAMAQMVEMGMDEGMREAMDQIDAILAESVSA